MKIHTTQNLENSTNILSTNINASNSLRYPEKLKRTHERERMPQNNDIVSFKGKRDVKFIKHVIEKAAEGMGNGGKNPKGSFFSELLDKVLTSNAFRKVLEIMDNEVLVQAMISALICMILRPLTIVAMAGKKDDKGDNLYAASHSIASGTAGLVASFIITTPFAKGLGYAKSNAIPKLKAEVLEKMFPNLNMESIWKDKANGIRKPIGEWLDKQGNTFSKEFKNVMKVAKPKHISEVSEETLKSLGLNVDLASQKGKKFSEMVDRNGKKLHLETKDMFIELSEAGMGKNGKPGKNYFSLEFIDKDFLGEAFKDLNLATIEKDGKRLHPENWKNKDGSQFMPDILDHIHVSSYKETANAIPLYTGRTRIDTLDKNIIKYTSYQPNGSKGNGGVPDKLGSEISQEMLNADYVNDIKYKALNWLPDIVTRPLVASSTIALLPLVLKKVFGLEKHKKPQVEATQNKPQEVAQPVVVNNTANEAKLLSVVQGAEKTEGNVNFKGAKPNKSWFTKMSDKLSDMLGKFFSDNYAEPMMNKKWMQTMSEKLAKVPGQMTEHMATLGSFITSGVYVAKTLGNKDLDDDKKRTLSINQVLCFIVPTICAYTVNKSMGGLVKKLGYRFSGLYEHQKATGKISKELVDKIEPNMGKLLKSVGALGSLATFTLIYRYITPVAITPAANKIGERINKKKAEEKQKAQMA